MDIRQHDSSDSTLPGALSLQRLCGYFKTYISIDNLRSKTPKLRKTEMERLSRFAAQFPYGLVLHFFNEPLPFFVSPAFFSLAACRAVPPYEAGLMWLLAIKDNNCSPALGAFMANLIAEPYEAHCQRCRFLVGDVQVDMFWCSCAVRLNGRKAYAVLSLFAPAAVLAAQPAATPDAEAAELQLMMSFTPREYEVYPMLQQPGTNRERASRLCQSLHTFNTHRKSIARKIKKYRGG